MTTNPDWNISTGVVFRNPYPHLSSRNAYFPSVIINEEQEMLVSFAIGEAFEAVNLDTYICRSTDGGSSWSAPELLLEKETQYMSQFVRLTYLGNGETIAVISRCMRDEHPDEGLANPDNMGFVPTRLLLLRSSDFGKTWGRPEEIVPPLTGPSFEMCSAIVRLSDGAWIWPTSTWRGWSGYEPEGMKMVALVSEDRGITWPKYWTVMDNHREKIIYWESKIIEMPDRTLVAAAWTYDEKNGRDLPIHFSHSRSHGKEWSRPASTGLSGQTVFIAHLKNNYILTIYRRTDEPGLWGAVADVGNNNWTTLYQVPLWGASNKSLLGSSGNMVQDFNELKFGAPSVVRYNENEFFIVFWCYEKLVSNIRWIRISIQ